MKTKAAYLYNPKNQTEQELINGFVIRQKQFQQIFNIVKADKMNKPCQHFIIQGLRGTGKTTLLMRLYYEIRRTEDLTKWLIPIIFNEEQYGINRLYKLWYNIAVELEECYPEFLGIVDKIDSIDNIDNIEEESRSILFELLKKEKKKIIVLIDNIGDILKKLNKKELQIFREQLLTNNSIRVVGGSAIVLESTYDYKQPFFEFFKILSLKELNSKETIELLKKVDEGIEDQNLEHVIKNHPGRIEALRILTGGIPRTIVMLYEIFVNDKNGGSFRDLEILLDRVTPLYKHRMDSLSSQQQEIMDVIALNCDAIPVKQIARLTKMESKAVSAQLNALLKSDLIVKKATSTKNNLYQVKERFFNIWYIMRNGRRSDRNKVRWLVKFIEVWCSQDEVDNMATVFIDKIKNSNIYGKYAFHVSEVYAQKVRSYKLQQELFSETKKYIESCNSELFNDLTEPDLEFIKNKIIQLKENKEFDKAITLLINRQSNTGILDYLCGIIYRDDLSDINTSIEFFRKSVEKGFEISMYELGTIYMLDIRDLNKAEMYFDMAAQKNHINSIKELIRIYLYYLKNSIKAKFWIDKAMEFGDIESCILLGDYYEHVDGDDNKAIDMYNKAINKGDDSTKAQAYYSMALVYAYKLKVFQQSEDYFLKAINYGDKSSIAAFLWMLINTINKQRAISYIEELESKAVDNLVLLGKIFVKIWKDDVSESLNDINEILNDDLAKNEFTQNLLLKVITLLMAKKQCNYVYNLFEREDLNLKIYFKPVYYALMILMKDQFPDEYLKMGSELEEPVNKVLNEIKEFEKVYG